MKIFPIENVKAFLIMNNITNVEVAVTGNCTRMELTFKFTNTALTYTVSTADQEKAYKETIAYIGEMDELYKQSPYGEFPIG